MITALIVVAGVAAGLTGLAAFLGYRWHQSNERAWRQIKGFHTAKLYTEKINAQYETALGTIGKLEAENASLAAALKEADEAYREQVELNIKDIAAPSTADALRLALGRMERLRSQVPNVSSTTAAVTTESGGGGGEVHEAGPDAPTEG